VAEAVTTWKIVFTCDDRGRHKEQVVYTQALHFGDIATVDARGISLALPGEVFELGCRLCPRRPRLHYLAAVKIAGDALAEFRGGAWRFKQNICDLPQ
jgi:hypothetical protein